MSIDNLWQEAIQNTEIVRLPIKRLMTFDVSHFSYIFLAASDLHKGDTVVRKGKMRINRPALFLPENSPQFKGFSDDVYFSDAELSQFFYARGVSLPSLTYAHDDGTLDLWETPLFEAEKRVVEEVRMQEKVSTGVLVGKNDSWQFSILFMACHMIDSQIDDDLKAILGRIKKR